MPNIQVVDYEKIPGYAKNMRGQAERLNKEITEAYASVNEMRKAWYGKRYNDLVRQFNGMIPELNEMLTLVVTNIPATLEAVANNYAKVDTGKAVTMQVREPAKKISEVGLSNEEGLHFQTTEVTAKEKSISKNFNNAKELMNQIESTYKQITWKSEAADAFKARFTKLKTNIVKAFDETEKQFKKLMDAALEDMKKAEGANTVK